MAIAPYAAKNGYPILLSDKNSLSQDTKNQLKGKKQTIIVGGTAIISKNVENQTPKPKRIAGSGRYETAVEIVKAYHMNSQDVYIATGLNFADALTGSVLAAKNNAPVLIVNPNQLPTAVNNMLNSKKFINVTTLGSSTGAVSDGVLNAINKKLNNTIQTATPLTLNKDYRGLIQGKYDTDYYKFSLNNLGTG